MVYLLQFSCRRFAGRYPSWAGIIIVIVVGMKAIGLNKWKTFMNAYQSSWYILNAGHFLYFYGFSFTYELF